MAKQLNVNMKFNADTSQAKQAIQELQNSLKDIAKMPGNASNLFDDKEIKKASQTALELQSHLQKAVNVNTGKLDLSRFASSLKSSNKDLSTYAQTLLNTGKQGQQAFLQLAQAIAAADTPVTRINSKLADLGTTLKNTAKWQISSSMLHGFMGTIQSAYGYAQDLNRSLNDIRIVTGQNIEQMAKFAETANKSAKALSTSTTDYTKASLIYYQQGLSEAQVKERTDVTIKMANVAGQSAQTVSDQMTAIWNNFDDGSKSMEYFADVMTALGAATASSTDEIAGGLEKFAGIAQTIGLSYEYAASALATITSNSRESEEVVGTALKAIFARIQGLNLGETLEDGVDLNKYSEALETVGINILEQNGELKKMDIILDELGAKWNTLNNAQQTALAQTVAGVRQYNQLVTLMNNWNNGDSDSMMANLNTVSTSEGELQKQADIYAESWEAASDRVRAAAEGIYQNLIDDEFFIDLLGGFEKVLETINGVVQGLGGMKGVITLIGSLFLTQFAQKMPEALNNLRQNLMVFTGQSKKVMSEMQSELNLTIAAQKADPGLSESYKIQLEGIQKINTMKQKLVAVSKSLTSQEQEEYKMKIQNVEAMYKEAAALAEKKKAAEQLEAKTQKTAENTAIQKSSDIFKQYNDSEAEVFNLMDKATTPSKSAEDTAAYAAKIEETRKKAVALEMSIEKIKTAIKGLDEIEDLDDVDIGALMGVGTADQQAAAQGKVTKAIKETSEAFKSQIKQRSNLEEMSSSIVSQGEAWKKVAQEVKKVESDKVKNLSNVIDTTKQKMAAYLQIIQKIAKENGLELNAEDVSNLANKINSLDSNNIEEITNDFSTFANEVSGKAQNAIGGLDTSIGNLRRTMSNLQFDPTEVKEMEQAADGAATAAQELKNSMDNIGGVVDENVEGTFKMSVALTEFASVAMSVSSLISSLKGVINTFTDEGASGFEKFGALLSIIMPAMSTFNAIQSLATTLSKNATIAKWAETTAVTAVTKAKWAENAAWLASPITWIVGAILGAVAALGLLVAGILAVTKALKNWYNEDAIAADRAATAADNLANRYQNAKTAYENMISTMEHYQSAREGLESLQEGTEEYRKKLNEANEEALKLIDLLGLIKGEGYTVEDGQIIIKEESADYQQKSEEFQKDMTMANNAKMAGDAQKKIAEAKANQTELVRSDDHQVLSNWSKSGAAGASAFGATALGSVAGPIGAFAGAGLGALLGSIFGLSGGAIKNSISNKEEEERINKLVESYKKDETAAFEQSNLNKLGFGDESEEYINSLKEVVKGLAEGSNALDTVADIASSTLLENEEKIQNSSYKDDITKNASKIYGEEYQKAYKNTLEEAAKGSKDVWDDFADVALSQFEDVKVDEFLDDGTVKYSYKTQDEDGKEVTKTEEATKEEIAAAIASSQAADATVQAANKLASAAEKLGKTDTIQGDIVASQLASGNLDGTSLSDLKSLAVNPEEILASNPDAWKQYGFESVEAFKEGFLELDNIGLVNLIESTFTGEELKELGYESAAQYVEAFKIQYDAAMAEWNGLETFGDHSLGEAQQLGEISNTLGGTPEIESTVNDFYSGLNEEEQEIFLTLDFDEETSRENWVEAIENIKDEKIEVEIEVKTNADAEEFGLDPEQLNEVANAFAEMDNLIQDSTASTEEIAEAAADAATRYMRLQNAVIDLSKNYKKYKGVLQDVKKSSDQVDKAMIMNLESGKDLKKALAGLLGTTEDLVDADLVDAINPSDFEQAARGNESAIKRIRNAFIDIQAAAIDTSKITDEALKDLDISEAAQQFKEDLDSLDEGAYIDINTSPFLQALIESEIAAGATEAQIKSKLSGFGIDCDTVQFFDDMTAAMDAADGTGDYIVDALSYTTDTTVQTNDVEKSGTVMGYTETLSAKPLPKTNKVLETGISFFGTENASVKSLDTVQYAYTKKITENPIPVKETETNTVEQKEAKKGKGKPKYAVVKGPKKSAGNTVAPSTKGNANNNMNSGGGGGGGGDGGGGGSTPKKAQPTKKSEIIDRFKEVDDKLSDLKRTSDQTSSSLDKLYGEEKVKAVNDLIEAERQYKDALKEKQDLAKDALDEDRKIMEEAAEELGLKFEYDENGNISNYTTEMEKLYNRLHELEKSAGDEWDENEQKQIDDLKEKISALKDAQSQYEETKKLLQELDAELASLAGKPAFPLVKSDYVDIYKEINDALDDIERKLDRIAQRADDAFGKNRVEKFFDFVDGQKTKLEQIDEALSKNKEDRKQKKKYLNKVVKELDVGQEVIYDEKGNISNYEEIVQVLYQRVLDEYSEAKKDDGKISDEEQKGIDALLSDVSFFEDAANSYSDAVDYKEELVDQKHELKDNVSVLPVVPSDFLDIYRETNDQLDDIDRKVQMISDKSERFVGKQKVAQLRKLIDLEKDRLDIIEEQMAINKQSRVDAKAAMNNVRRQLGIDTKFEYDENRNITNYEEIMTEFEKRYTVAYTKAMEDGIINAAEKEWLEKFIEDGKLLEEYMNNYASAVDEYEDLKDQKIEATQAVSDYLLEALSYTVEFNIEVSDRSLALIEYQLRQLEDQSYSTAESMSLLSEKYEALNDKVYFNQFGISQLLNTKRREGTITDSQLEQLASGNISSKTDWSKVFTDVELGKLNEYSDNLLELNQELLDLRTTMDEAVIGAFEEWTSEIEEQISLFDHYNAVLDNYNNIIDLIGQKKLGITDEDMIKYSQLNVENSINKFKSTSNYRDEMDQKIADTEKERQKALGRLGEAEILGDQAKIDAAKKDLKSWDDTLDIMYKERQDLEQQFLSDWKTALTNSREAFLTETGIQLEQLEKQIAGTYETIENMQKDFKRQSEVNDRYLKDYEKIYELSKLNRELTKKMDETTNVRAKQQLAEFQEEILNYQKEGRKLSDYDLKYLKKKYELKLAEIALEEAQNAKSQVRLTRDSEGNYNYTYTVDEDALNKAYQTYEDKLYETTNLSNEYIEQQTSKLLSTQQEFINEIQSIHKKASEGYYATTEEYQQALDDCTAYYTDLMLYYGDEIDKAAKNNAATYENDYQTYSGFAIGKAGMSKEEADAYLEGVKAKSDAEAGFVTTITQLLPGLSEAHTSATRYVESMVGTIGNAEEGTGLLGQASKSYDDFYENVDLIMQEAGTSLEDFKDDSYEYLISGKDSISNQSDRTANSIEKMFSVFDGLDDTISKISAWQTAYSAELEEVTADVLTLITAITSLNTVIGNQTLKGYVQEGFAAIENVEEPKEENPLDDIKIPTNLQPTPEPEQPATPKPEQPATPEPEQPATPEPEQPATPEPEQPTPQGLENLPAKTKKGIAYAIWSGYWGNGTARKTLVDKKLGKDSYKTYQTLVNEYKIEKKAKDGTWVADLFGKNVPSNPQKTLKTKYGPSAFFTGGYTGAWGPEGKFAILHEKELVLNQQDTENMLKIISMVRDLSAILDLQAYNSSLAKMQANHLYQVDSNGRESFEQTVTIHAEFPNVSKSQEIETALKNLVNSASQYANRK